MFFGRLQLALVLAGVVAAAAAECRAQGYGAEPHRIPGPEIELVPAPAPHTLAELVEQAITVTSQRKMVADVHTPWQVVHGIVGLRWDCKLKQGNTEISAIEWIFSGSEHNGQPLWEVTPYGGHGHPYTKPYAHEGHPTQFLGYMCMSNIPLDYEIQADKGVITVRDVINDAKMQVKEGPEITWTLWALAHYLEPDAEWTNAKGEAWSIERLVELETKEEVTKNACGGCHGLFALAYARNMYLSTGKPLTGVWLECDQKLKRYVEMARSLQNTDGSFSSNHFKGPGVSGDYIKRMSSSGHQLEWLMIALPQRRLNEPWVQKGVRNVASDLLRFRREPADCGPLGHALHSLVLYRQRTTPGATAPVCTSPLKLADRIDHRLVRVPVPETTARPAATEVK